MLSVVTGGTGFVGVPLVRALVARGDRVRVIGRRASMRWRNEPKVEHIRADIFEGDTALTTINGADRVFHLAATTEGCWDEYQRVTVGGADRVLQAMATCKTKRLIFVSSLSVYEQSRFRDGMVVDEYSPLQNNSSRRSKYARAKCLAEELAQEYGRAGKVPVTIVRPGVVFGPGMKSPLTGVAISVKNVFWLMTGHPAQLLPAIYIDDLVTALLLAATCPEAIGKTFNLVNPEMPTHREVLELYRRMSGDKRIAVRLPSKAALPMLRLFDWSTQTIFGQNWQTSAIGTKLASKVVYSSSLVEREIGFVAKTPFSVGMANVVA
jgi:nucleoside-diphosphate-sugar epimerase